MHNGIFRMPSGMPQGIVVMREWEDLGCAAYQSHVQQKVMKLSFRTFCLRLSCTNQFFTVQFIG